MSPGSRRAKPEQSRAAAAALLAAAPLVTRWMERLLAAQGEPSLTASQYLALRAIAEEPLAADEPLAAAELAHRTAVSGPAVSQLLAGLVDAGWVRREPAARDRRRQELFLTDDGVAVLATVEQGMTARLSELLSDAPRPELDALTHALPFVRSALAGTPPPRRPGPPHPPGDGPPHPPGDGPPRPGHPRAPSNRVL